MPKKQEKRKDGRYAVYLSLGFDPDTGKRVRKAFYGETQTEAKKKRDEWLKNQDKQIVEGKKPLTVSQWADRWLETAATGGYSMQLAHRGNMRLLTANVGNKLMKDVLPIDIQAFANTYSKHSKTYVAKIRHDVTNLFSYAVDNNIIPESPCRNIKWGNSGEGTHRALEPWERDLFTAHWNEHSAGIWAMLMLYAGMRPGEALALNWDNIRPNSILICDARHYENNMPVITEGQTKTDSGQREVPIVPPLKAMLDALPRKDGELVCTSESGGPVTQSAYKRNWATFLNILRMKHLNLGEGFKGKGACGLRVDKLPEETRSQWDNALNVTPYDLRHSYCSMLFDADVDVKTAQYLMGHKSLEITLKIYTHLSELKKQRSYDKLFAFFKQAGSQDGSQKSQNPD